MNEYQFSIYSSGLYYSSEPNFLSANELLGKTGFASLYSVSEAEAGNIKQAGTTANFAGSVWSERLWLDIDSYEKAEEVEKRLKEMGYDYVAFDTGHRGAHFGILRPTAPSHLLPLQDKLWAGRFFPEADRSLYTHLHLFRLEGTIHSKTGQPKVLVSRQGGRSLELPKYEKPTVSPYVPSDRNVASSNTSRSIFDNFLVMSATKPAENGNRHPTLVKLAFSLRDSGVPIDKAYWWLEETNKMFEEPKDEKELSKIIEDVYSKG